MTAHVLSESVPLRWSDGAELAFAVLSSRLRNLQSTSRSPESRRHYDLGNDLYGAMLDRRMVHSCAYWRGAATLEEAQEGQVIIQPWSAKQLRRILRVCRLYDYERQRWIDYDGTPTTESR